MSIIKINRLLAKLLVILGKIEASNPTNSGLEVLDANFIKI